MEPQGRISLTDPLLVAPGPSEPQLPVNVLTAVPSILGGGGVRAKEVSPCLLLFSRSYLSLMLP